MFAPIVVLLRNWVGIERTARQNMIRTARDNGKKLGLLA